MTFKFTWGLCNPIQVNVTSILYIFAIKRSQLLFTALIRIVLFVSLVEYELPLPPEFTKVLLWGSRGSFLSMNCLSLRSSQRFIVGFAWLIPEYELPLPPEFTKVYCGVRVAHSWIICVQCFYSSLFFFFLFIFILSFVVSCTSSDYFIGIFKLFLLTFDKNSLFVLYTRSYFNFNRSSIATIVC